MVEKIFIADKPTLDSVKEVVEEINLKPEPSPMGTPHMLQRRVLSGARRNETTVVYNIGGKGILRHCMLSSGSGVLGQIIIDGEVVYSDYMYPSSSHGYCNISYMWKKPVDDEFFNTVGITAESSSMGITQMRSQNFKYEFPFINPGSKTMYGALFGYGIPFSSSIEVRLINNTSTHETYSAVVVTEIF